MATLPLSLNVQRLSPSTLLLDPTSPTSALPIPLSPLPLPVPPVNLLSPTHNYLAPYPSASLGSNLSLLLCLSARQPVRGVKMMCEVQSPAGRVRLGEVVHGQSDEVGEEDKKISEVLGWEGQPELQEGESVEMHVGMELKELGLAAVICSVAWETVDGRRTFQRFFKFHVNPPLMIKTRILPSSHPDVSLDPIKREQVHLEVLMENSARDGMVFQRVSLEAVHGLRAESIGLNEEGRERGPGGEDEGERGDRKVTEGRALMLGDHRQYLFFLFPLPAPTSVSPPVTKSTFPPLHLPGTILPLGRLDLSWIAGPHHDAGRLQTSTLNRRITASHTPASIAPTRTTSAASPAPGAIPRLGSPSSAVRGPPPSLPPKGADLWEYDLVVLHVERGGVGVEREFRMKCRVGVRGPPIDTSSDGGTETAPPPLMMGVQNLTRPPLPSIAPLPSPIPRGAGPSPMSRTNTATNHSTTPSRPFSLLRTDNAASRPMTPVSSQLRQATTQSLTSSHSIVPPPISLPHPSPLFPPPPVLSPSRTPKWTELRGEVQHLGVSLNVLEPGDWHLVEEDVGTTYADPTALPKRWEMTHEIDLRFIALEVGLAELGGLRVLVFDDEVGLKGSIGREWESLGDVWVVDDLDQE